MPAQHNNPLHTEPRAARSVEFNVVRRGPVNAAVLWLSDMKSKKQFTFRAFLVFHLLIAVLLAFWIRGANKQASAVAEIKRNSGSVSYDFDSVSESVVPSWLSSFLGPDYFYNVEVVILNTSNDCPADEQVRQLAALKGLSVLTIFPPAAAHPTKKNVYVVAPEDLSGLTNDGARYVLKNLRSVEQLTVFNARLTDAVVRELADSIDLLTVNRHPDFGGDNPEWSADQSTRGILSKISL